MHLATRRSFGAVALAVAVAVLGVAAQPAAGVTPSRQRALEGSSYIVSQQRANGAICAFSCVGSTADAVLALVATRTAPRAVQEAVAYLRRQVRRDHVAGLGLRAKVVMAAVAGGANPRAFGGENLVRSIAVTEGDDGRYDAAAVFDQALAMLALRAAGAGPSAAARSWLVAAQCDDGGWQYDEPARPDDDAHCFDATAPSPGDFFTSDSNTTSLAVQVLRTGGAVEDALAFLPTLRDGDDGWGYSQCCTDTDVNSTALAIQAYVASGAAVPTGGFASLRRSQLACGAWPYQPGGAGDIGATIGAILGILRQPLPVSARSATAPLPPPGTCG
jgi:hypothetical protein